MYIRNIQFDTITKIYLNFAITFDLKTIKNFQLI